MKRVVILLIVTLASCATTTTTSDTPRATMSGFMDALNSLDMDGMTSYFADDITAFFPVAQGERANGKAAVVEIFRKYVDGTKKTISRTNIVPEDLRVDQYGDVAIVTFNVHNPS